MIEGSVTDLENTPLPGATISASSPAQIGGSMTARTNEHGYYRFPAVAPGIYQVSAELAGFKSMERKGLRVFVGTAVTTDFRLELTQTAERLDIVDDAPLIDITTTAVSVNIPSEIVSNLPKLQRIEELFKLTPGVGDDLVAYGADGVKGNSIWIDGVNLSDPRNGDLPIRYDYNWIDHVQVTAIGAPAEYGGFTGVVGNFVTRSGGNQIHGGAELFFQNEKLTFNNVPENAIFQPGEDFPFQTYEISLQLGGPIQK
ncbi:MAG: carboxypeptidase regulatory-like domain-containing protein, partial [Acidobacteriota bacterium]